VTIRYTGLGVVVAKVLVDSLLFLINFVIQQRYIFKSKIATPSED